MTAPVDPARVLTSSPSALPPRVGGEARPGEGVVTAHGTEPYASPTTTPKEGS